jgi:hypothetical protein
MISFTSLNKALAYRTICPFCDSHLEINDRDLASIDYVYDAWDEPKYVLSFYMGSNNDDLIKITLPSEEVEINFSTPKSTFGTTASMTQLITSGRIYHRLVKDCKRCCQYSFTLQVVFYVEAPNAYIGNVHLNSECISVEDGKLVHEIKNVYSTEKTEYSSFSKDGSTREAVLPLIPMDVKNPNDMISRIRKLLIFS